MTNNKQNAREQERLIMDAGDIARALTRVAHEILERNKGVKEIGRASCRERV